METSPRPIAIDCCFVCGVIAKLRAPTGRRAAFVTATQTPEGLLESRCLICEAVCIEGSIVSIASVPDPDDVEALVRAAYPAIPKSVDIWIAPEDRRWRLQLVPAPRDEEAR